MASLIVLQCPPRERAPQDLTLLKKVQTFGRDGKCDFRLEWDGCSRLHFSILGLQPDGSGIPTEFELVDEGNGTNNGVFLNGRRVLRASICDGDLIGVGRGRDVQEGGKISDHNLEYVWQLRSMRDRAGKACKVRGKLADDLANEGMHRKLRGQSRHPLGGHRVAGEQRVAKERRAELPSGELIAPFRSLVYCPSHYTPSPADNSAPKSHLQLEFVYGIRSHDVSGVVHFVDAERILYPAGGLVVLYDMSTNTQSFFVGHDDDVVSLAMHPNRRIAASGQLASLRRRTPEGQASASVMIFNISTMDRDRSWSSRGVLARELMHRILALDFDPTGNKLVVFGAKQDGSSRVCVYDWRAGKLLWHLSGGSTIVTAVKHNKQDPRFSWQFVQTTEKTIRFWDHKVAETEPDQSFKTGTYLKWSGKNVQSNAVTYTQDGSAAIVAMSNGAVYFFAANGAEITVVNQIKDAHRGEVYLVHNVDDKLITSGSDGYIKFWSYQWGGDKFEATTAPKLVGQVSLRPFAHSGSEKIIAARNLDVFQNKLILATNTNLILEVTDYFSVGIGDHSTRCPLVNVIQDFHSGESRATWDPASAVPKAQPIGLMAVSAYPKQGSGPTLMCTAGEDRSVRVWNADQRNLHTLANGKHAVANTGMPCSCCDVSPDARLIVVGHTGGQFTVWDASTMLCVLENCYRKRTVSVVRFSRDSKLLVVCTHEKSLDCYAVRDNYRHVGHDHQRHSASITSADFSTDGKLVRTCDNAGELLYWHLPSLRSYAGNAADLRDVNWATQTCLVAWDKKSMWGPGYSLSDINAVAVSPMRDCLVSGEDDGCLRVFRYPAVGSDVKSVVYAGHSSAIEGLAFSEDQRYIMSVGGYDVCMLQWRHILPSTRNQQHRAASAGPLGMRAD